MTTQSWSFAADHQSDAGFRLWGADFAAKLAAVGMVQTADTGQINWASVTRPGTNTDGGYEIWRFADTMQATAPIFLRINYGTGSVATRPRIQIIVGTSSNGSGTIGGTALTATLTTSAGTGTATGSSFTSYMAAGEGYFWFAWLAGGATTGLASAFCAVLRTTDSAGAPTARGALILYPAGATSVTSSNGGHQHLRFEATAVAYTVAAASGHMASYVVAPASITTTLIGSDPQTFPFMHWTPDVTPCLFASLVKLTEVAELSTFDCTMFGSTSHTYICMGQEMAVQWYAAGITLWGYAFIWE